MSSGSEHLLARLQLWHFRIPEHESVYAHVGSAKTGYGGLEPLCSGVGDPRTEDHVRSRNDAAGAPLNARYFVAAPLLRVAFR